MLILEAKGGVVDVVDDCGVFVVFARTEVVVVGVVVGASVGGACPRLPVNLPHNRDRTFDSLSLF